MGREEEEEAFLRLKEVCLKCVREPDLVNLEAYKGLVGRLEPRLVDPLQEYLLFPLQMILSQSSASKSQPLPESVLRETLHCLEGLLGKTAIRSFELWRNIYLRLFYLIDDRVHEQEEKGRISEDLKMASIKAVESLIKSADAQVMSQITRCPTFRPALGHSISVLVNLAVNERYKSLKLLSVQVLGTLLQSSTRSHSEGPSNEVEVHPGDVFASFLPGISVSLMKLIINDDKQSQALLIAVLNTFSSIITLTLSEESESNEISPEPFVTRRDSKWFQETSLRLKVALENVVRVLVVHRSAEVRKTLFCFCRTLFTRCCSSFLVHTLTVLLEVPLVMLSDESEDIKSECEQFLEDYSHNIESKEQNMSLRDLMLEECYHLLSQIPREMRTLTDREKLVKVNLLYGYITSLGRDGTNLMLNSASHRQRLFQCLIDMTQFDYRNVFSDQIVVFINEGHRGDLIWEQEWPPKRFQYLSSISLVNCLKLVCRKIGENAQKEVIIDSLLDNLYQSNFDPCVIFVCNAMIESRVESIGQDIHEEYLSILKQDSPNEADRVQGMKVSLVIEGIALFASSLEGDSASLYLIKSLYLITEKVGSNCALISRTAKVALVKMAKGLGYQSVKDMVQANVDYLISSLNVKLKHFEQNADITVVVKVILDLSDAESMLPYLEEVVDNALDILDSYHHQKGSFLLQLIQVIVAAIGKLRETSRASAPTATAIGTCTRNINIFEERLVDFVRNTNIIESMEDVEENNDSVDSLGPAPDPETELAKEEEGAPFWVVMIEKILKRCIHLMSFPEVEVRLAAVTIVANGLIAMKPFANRLLPMAHKLWAPLVKRFADEEPVVIKQSLACLLVMSDACGDFIRPRTMSDVMPKLLSFIRTQSKESLNKGPVSGYWFTLRFHLQQEALSALGPLTVHLDVQDKELWLLMRAVLPYLSTRQPLPLQEAAVIAFGYFARVDADSAWFHLSRVCPDINTDFVLVSQKSKVGEFNRNVGRLIKEIEFIAKKCT